MVEPPSRPSPTPTQDSRITAIGEPVTFAGATITVNSFKVLSQIKTVDGTPLVAGEDEQLVLFNTHFVNESKGTVDLSCAGYTDWYIQAFDTEGREMAAVFDTYRIPGNQKCNHELLSGQESEWNFAFRQIAGATPMYLQVTDTRTYSDIRVVNLTDKPLRISTD
jgi:hypothetical protein